MVTSEQSKNSSILVLPFFLSFVYIPNDTCPHAMEFYGLRCWGPQYVESNPRQWGLHRRALSGVS